MKTINYLQATKLLLLGVLGLLFFIWLSSFGTVNFTFSQIIRFIFTSQESSESAIYIKLRLPRVLLAFLIGASLSIAGDSLQLTLKNPLADPYIIGISAGGAFGAVLSMVMNDFLGISISMEITAFSFALISAFMTYYISRRGGRVPVTNLILSGVIVSFLFNAAVTFIVVFAWRNIISLHFWSLGSLSGATWSGFWKMLPVLIIESIIYMLLRRKMLILATGEQHALTLGIEPEKLKFAVFVMVAFVSGISVAIAGLIGFVGLIIPHISRLMFGTDSRINLFSTLIIGGLFLSVCDTIARTMFQPTELPLGAITALIGAPMFIYLLRKRVAVSNE
ncbi:MAG: iron ABC transporter permease [Kosmotoga sp.]|nr:MAG: iron ABC transporter permease [Kosmotoga sp.]